MCRWLNRWEGLAMRPGGDEGWEVTLPRWQLWQSRHQAATWDARPGQTKWLEISLLVALIPGCARLCTASKMGHRKTAGTRGLKTPEEVSTRMGEPWREISETRWAGDDLARWQSGQAGCAAASAPRSTGDGEGSGLAVAGGTEDPEGTFTSVDP
jgi:hypothetical protein